MIGADIEMADFRGSVLREIQGPPFRAMACPSHEAFTAWMVDYQVLEEGLKRHEFIGMIIPEDAIRISNYNGICRTNKVLDR